MLFEIGKEEKKKRTSKTTLHRHRCGFDSFAPVAAVYFHPCSASRMQMQNVE